MIFLPTHFPPTHPQVCLPPVTLILLNSIYAFVNSLCFCYFPFFLKNVHWLHAALISSPNFPKFSSCFGIPNLVFFLQSFGVAGNSAQFWIPRIHSEIWIIQYQYLFDSPGLHNLLFYVVIPLLKFMSAWLSWQASGLLSNSPNFGYGHEHNSGWGPSHNDKKEKDCQNPVPLPGGGGGIRCSGQKQCWAKYN